MACTGNASALEPAKGPPPPLGIERGGGRAAHGYPSKWLCPKVTKPPNKALETVLDEKGPLGWLMDQSVPFVDRHDMV